MAQISGFDPTPQVKTCFDCKMFDVANWVACLNGENGPEGTPSHDALSVLSQGALEISSVTRQPLPWTETISAHLDWWQTPANVMRGADIHPKDTKGSTKRLWSDQKRLHINVLRVKGGLPYPSKLLGPVSELNSASCNGQLSSGSLHKQARRNSLSRDVHSPVEDHDMVSLLSHNIKSHTHSRGSECDGRPPVQVEPSAVNRICHCIRRCSKRSVKSGSLLM